MTLALQRLSSVRAIPPAEWDRVAGPSPFARHAFLLALEESGSIGPGTGWEPAHLAARDARGTLVGLLPLYIKHDSFGEFVFDWGWADAYERTGRAYYPKLVTAIPFTPATGERVLVAPDAERATVAALLIDGARAFAEELDVSSWHVLFPAEHELPLFAGLLLRKSCQFHWRNDGYRDFDDFLGRFSSEKRKKARRERRRIAEAGIRFERLPGDAPSAAEWDAIFAFYARTFLRRGRMPYLNRQFFDLVAASMPESLLIVLARHGRQPIAAAICFQSPTALYGRYWGSAADFHSLHFETCYYQGIEHCIERGLELFEPGTQGEHKIARGFSPTATWSCHWLRDRALRRAVETFLKRETRHVDAYMEDLDDHVPYRRAPQAAPR